MFCHHPTPSIACQPEIGFAIAPKLCTLQSHHRFSRQQESCKGTTSLQRLTFTRAFHAFYSAKATETTHSPDLLFQQASVLIALTTRVKSSATSFMTQISSIASLTLQDNGVTSAHVRNKLAVRAWLNSFLILSQSANFAIRCLRPSGWNTKVVLACMCNVKEVSSCLDTAAGGGWRLRGEYLRALRVATAPAVFVPGVVISKAVPDPTKIESCNIPKLTDCLGPSVLDGLRVCLQGERPASEKVSSYDEIIQSKPYQNRPPRILPPTHTHLAYVLSSIVSLAPPLFLRDAYWSQAQRYLR